MAATAPRAVATGAAYCYCVVLVFSLFLACPGGGGSGKPPRVSSGVLAFAPTRWRRRHSYRPPHTGGTTTDTSTIFAPYLLLHPKGFGAATSAPKSSSAASSSTKAKQTPKQRKTKASPAGKRRDLPLEKKLVTTQYQPPAYKISHVSLDFDIASAQLVTVTANLTIHRLCSADDASRSGSSRSSSRDESPNPCATKELVLDGDAARLQLRNVTLWSIASSSSLLPSTSFSSDGNKTNNHPTHINSNDKSSNYNNNTIFCNPQHLQRDQDYRLTDRSLVISTLPALEEDSASSSFMLQTVVQLTPANNNDGSLSGLYFRDDMLVTHCEPTGFSQITYYLDRPDNTAVFTVRISAPKEDFDLLLSNGIRVDAGMEEEEEKDDVDYQGRRHYAVYHDPHPKPSYVFALVAARQLTRCAHGTYTPNSNTSMTPTLHLRQNPIQLNIYSESTAQGRLDFALATLQRAMAWEEATYGWSYDLDEYNIVAARHFSIGAMENKGLNLFQTSLISTHPNSTTDVTYDLVEKTVAHEYFHNTIGNRVTVQSWREFGLKEGATVFRDQEFTADVGLCTTVRIESVKILREKQFREDATEGVRHAVRPRQVNPSLDSLASSTTYHKGAEVCRMFQTVLGKECFRKGLQLFVRRHDGSSADWDDFRDAMAAANQVRLDQLGLWYSTAGTPTLTYRYTYSAQDQCLRLTLTQNLACQPDVLLNIPVAVGLLDRTSGQEILPTTVLQLTARNATFEFGDLPVEAVPSILRDFSAPVILVPEDKVQHDATLPFLAKYDTDGFNRWEAVQQLYANCIFGIMRKNEDLSMQESLFETFRLILVDSSIDVATKSYLVNLPTEAILSRQLDVENPAGVREARKALGLRIRQRYHDEIEQLYNQLTGSMPSNEVRTDATSRATRSLRNVLLDFLCIVEDHESHAIQVKAADLAMRHYDSATCLTDRLAAFRKLSGMTGVAAEAREEVTEKFHQYAQQNDPIVMSKWFQTQALADLPDVLERVQRLTQHPDFKATNAGLFRSLVTSFTMNAPAFHTPEGYRFIGSVISQIDRVAPTLAVELANKLAPWARHPPQRAALMKAELQRIISFSKEGVSQNLAVTIRNALQKQ